MIYPIVEIFQSLKGEGIHTGVVMTFIRFAGCNKNCNFCDTDFSIFTEMNITEIINKVLSYNSNIVVITGGEPLKQDLLPLLHALRKLGQRIHLETNGSVSCIYLNEFNWIAVSPKDIDCDPEVISLADEIKFLIGLDNWEQLIFSFMRKYNLHSSNKELLVMPITKGKNENQERSWNDIIDLNVNEAIQYCLENPRFRYCIQLHKVLQIK